MPEPSVLSDAFWMLLFAFSGVASYLAGITAVCSFFAGFGFAGSVKEKLLFSVGSLLSFGTISYLCAVGFIYAGNQAG